MIFVNDCGTFGARPRTQKQKKNDSLRDIKRDQKEILKEIEKNLTYKKSSVTFFK